MLPKKLWALLLACLCTTAMFAQEGVISGSVKTKSGMAVAFPVISIAEKKLTIVGNDTGYFRFSKLAYGTYTLSVSYLGEVLYTQQVTLNGAEQALSLQVVHTTHTMDEVKIIGVKPVIARQSDYVGKMPLNNMENAQVYTGISSTLITQQKIYNMDDVVRNAPGINKSNDGWPGSLMYGGVTYVSRGFSTEVRALNGLASNVVMPSDVQNLSKIEVIKGPSATLFGSVITSYGGLINRVTKKPYEEFSVAVDAAAGSYNFQRLGLDANMPINKEKTFLARLNVATSNQGNFTDNGGYYKNTLLAPAFTYKLNDKVKIDLSSEIYSTKTAGGSMGVIFTLLPSAVKQYTAQILSGMGLPAANINAIVNQMPSTVKEAFGTENVNEFGLDRFRSFMNKNMTANSQAMNLNATVTYKLSPQWTSTTSALYVSGSDEGYEGRFILLPNVVQALLTSLPTGNISFGTPGADYLGRNSRKFESSLSTHQIQQNFTGDFHIGQLRNRMVIGLDYYHYNSSSYWRNFNGTLFTVPFENFFDVVKLKGNAPNYYDFEKNRLDNLFETKQIGTYDYGTKNNIYSAFVNDVLNLTGNLFLNAGLRFDRFVAKGRYDGINDEWTEGFNQNALAPKFGVVYQPVANKLSVFANYQTGFRNVNGTDEKGSAFKPEQSYQWETGVKYALFNGNFTGTFSYYNITVNDIVRNNPNNIFFSIQDGTQKSKGFEAEILGNPTPQFNVMLGYAYNNSKYVRADASVDGLRPITAGPYHQGNIWLHYHFKEKTFLNNFSIGAGGNYVGRTWAMNLKPDGAFYVPAYTLVNAKISYDRNNYSLTMRVNNLLDEDIWTGSSSIRPQMPRQFVGSVAIKF
ncbi:iron complex outermembrane receptor protein [Filimonas zeae]|nr:TonB-dependent receptor [Filimonas zeae]MDR6340229.1 iron complex outermembrane receptor protein [Filimonas zeae]